MGLISHKLFYCFDSSFFSLSEQNPQVGSGRTGNSKCLQDCFCSGHALYKRDADARPPEGCKLSGELALLLAWLARCPVRKLKRNHVGVITTLIRCLASVLSGVITTPNIPSEPTEDKCPSDVQQQLLSAAEHQRMKQPLSSFAAASSFTSLVMYELARAANREVQGRRSR